MSSPPFSPGLGFLLAHLIGAESKYLTPVPRVRLTGDLGLCCQKITHVIRSDLGVQTFACNPHPQKNLGEKQIVLISSI